MNEPKNAFETINEPSLWQTDKKAKRQNKAINAAASELRNRGLTKRENFTTYSKAKPK